MKKYFSGLTMFKRLLFSYLAIILVAVLMIVIFTNNFFVKTLSEELIQRDIDKLNTIKSDIDINIKELNNIKDRLILDIDYNAYYNLKNPNNIIELQRELSKYVSQDGFISDILFYIHGDKYIYSSTSSYTIPFFAEKAYKYENKTADDIYGVLQNGYTPLVWPAENMYMYSDNPQKMITFIFPLLDAGLKNRGTIMFLVEQSYFDNISNVDLYGQKSDIYVIDSDKKLVTKCGNFSNEFVETELTDVIEKKQPGIIRLGNNKYLVSIVCSNLNNWKYVSLTLTDEALKKAYNAQMIFILVSVLLLMFSMILIYCNTKFNYAPIGKLKSYAQNIFTSGKNNDIDIIQNVIEHLKDKNKSITDKYCIISKKQFVDDMLRGNIKANSQIDTDIFNFEASFYVVGVIYFRNENDMNTAKDYVEKIIKEEYKGIIKTEEKQNKIIAVMPIEEVCEQRINLEKMYVFLKKFCKEKVTIGIGSVCDNMEDIPQSYIDASVAVDYRVIKGMSEVIYFDDVELREDSFEQYPHKEIKVLRYKLKEGKIEEVEKELDNIINYVVNCDVSMFVVRGLCFEIINTICSVISELNQEMLIQKKYYIDVERLTNYETVEDLMVVVKNVCHNLSAVILENKSEHKDNILSEMIEYINNNYTNPDFSLQKMADEFGMTLTNLSQYFKNNTKNTILDYTTALRIKLATQMLANTDKTVDEISREVGYLNTSSFIRRFKKITGLTPGQYAKENRKNHN